MAKYIDIDLLREKIAREVEQWKEKTANHYTIEAEARWSEANYVLGILDSLQQEQSEQFMAKLQKSLEAGYESIKSSLADIAAVSEVLSSLGTFDKEHDKRLEEYASRAGFDYVDGIVQEEPGHRWNDHDVEFAYRDGIIAGAEWQASQMPMPEDTVLFNKGVSEGRRLEREDLLKDAVEGYVNYYEDSGGILMAEAQVGCPYHNGDKVRIIVLKEEDE